MTAPARQRLPNRRPNETFGFQWNGMDFTATFSRFPDGRLAEIFLSNGRVSTDADASARKFCGLYFLDPPPRPEANPPRPGGLLTSRARRVWLKIPTEWRVITRLRRDRRVHGSVSQRLGTGLWSDID
jgi:hypothetical protein